MKIEFAPVQGHTDSAYRDTHAAIYGSADEYYTPFIRKEKEGIRPRDLRDAADALRSGETDLPLVTPQIIFRDDEELSFLVENLHKEGHRRIDLNMGCPFPLQTAKGRGAALAGYAEMARRVAEITEQYPDIRFSVKMRLGLKDPDEWKQTLPELNKARLDHITLHPRVAAQQYGGSVDLSRFRDFLEMSANPVIYNGDILSPSLSAPDTEEEDDVISADWYRFREHPRFAGIMIGRGLLGRPSLAAEIRDGEEWDREKRLRKMLDFHRRLLHHYSDNLCGDSQVLSKIKPFWEYAEREIGRKPWKAIKKASNMAKYRSAVAMIED